jgi:hypothetical protein
MKPKITIKCRKKTNRSLPPAKYYPYGTGKEGKERINSAVIKIDPILNKSSNRKVKQIVLRHEIDEINARNDGATAKKAHKIATSKEPAWFSRKYKTFSQLQKGIRE